MESEQLKQARQKGNKKQGRHESEDESLPEEPAIKRTRLRSSSGEDHEDLTEQDAGDVPSRSITLRQRKMPKVALTSNSLIAAG